MKFLLTFVSLLIFLASPSLVLAETKTIPVSGMTCGGCVANVRKAVCTGLKYSKENCQVKIGELKLTGDNIDMAAVKAAIEDAGYEIAPPATATATATVPPTESAVVPAKSSKKKN